MKRLINAALHDPRSLYGLRPWRRHSLVLLVLGAIYFLVGVTYGLAHPTKERVESLQLALNIMPLRGWGVVWMVVGLLGMVSSRWPIPSEKWGYTMLSGMSALWACFYAWGPVYGAPPSTLTATLAWGGLAFLWWAISGLVNPVPHDMPPAGYDLEDRRQPW